MSTLGEVNGFLITLSRPKKTINMSMYLFFSNKLCENLQYTLAYKPMLKLKKFFINLEQWFPTGKEFHKFRGGISTL